MRNSIFIKIQSVPMLEQIEQGDRVSEPHLEIRPHSLAQVFQTANLRQKRENRFDQHSVIPLAARADFQIFRLVDFAPKASIRQDNHFVGNSFDKWQKLRVGNIRRFHVPTSHESELVGQKTKFAADNPFPRSKAFLADALAVWLMNLTNRMTQLNAVRINHTKEGRFCQKLFSYLTMRFEAAKKSGAFGQSRKKINPVLLDPSIKSVLRRAFQSKQQSKRNEFANRKFGLKMFLRFVQHIIYTTEKFYDKVFLSHGIGLLCVWFRHLHIRNFSVTFSTSTNS